VCARQRQITHLKIRQTKLSKCKKKIKNSVSGYSKQIASVTVTCRIRIGESGKLILDQNFFIVDPGYDIFFYSVSRILHETRDEK
jgi:hypothetical protein